MKLELQVCSLELAQKLKSLGVKQESLFYHAYNTALEDDRKIKLKKDCGSYKTQGKIMDMGIMKYYSAFTSAELGELIPGQLRNDDPEHPIHQFITEKSASQWHAVYVCAKCMGRVGSQWAATEADARAKMLVYLLENKLITL